GMTVVVEGFKMLPKLCHVQKGGHFRKEIKSNYIRSGELFVSFQFRKDHRALQVEFEQSEEFLWAENQTCFPSLKRCGSFRMICPSLISTLSSARKVCDRKYEFGRLDRLREMYLIATCQGTHSIFGFSICR